jgi:hypothetical protein
MMPGMPTRLPTYDLYGMEAIPADVLVEPAASASWSVGPAASWLRNRRACYRGSQPVGEEDQPRDHAW